MFEQLLQKRIKARLTPEEQEQLDAYEADKLALRESASNNLAGAQVAQAEGNATRSMLPAFQNIVRAAGRLPERQLPVAQGPDLVSTASKQYADASVSPKEDLSKVGEELDLDSPISDEERSMMNTALARFKKEGEAPVEIPEGFTKRQMNNNPVLKRFFTSVSGGPGMEYDVRNVRQPDGSVETIRFNKKTGEKVTLGSGPGIAGAINLATPAKVAQEEALIAPATKKAANVKKAQESVLAETDTAEAQAAAETSTDQLDNIASLHGSTLSGPVGGRLSKIASGLGFAPDAKAAELDSTLSTIAAKYIFDMTGKAATDAERKSLLASIPSVTDTPALFKIHMAAFKANVQKKAKEIKLREKKIKAQPAQSSQPVSIDSLLGD